MSDHLAIPDDLAQRTARLVDEIEDQLAAAQADKRQVYADLREELKDLGMAGPNISKHVAAFKAAISELRMTAGAKAKSVERDDQAFRYVEIIKAASRARAPARTREAGSFPDSDVTPEAVAIMRAKAAPVLTEMGFDPDTGEIIEPNSAPALPLEAAADSDSGVDATAVAPIQPETASPSPEVKDPSQSAVGTDNAGQPGEGTASSPAPANTNTKKRWSFSDAAHPDCLDADRCGGLSNLGLCARCKQAAGHVVQVEATA